MMKHFFLVFLFLLRLSFFSQDVTNDYISYVHVYFDNIAYSIPESYCDWKSLTEGDGEFRLRLDIWDGSQDFHSPTLEESGWYKGPCFQKSDGDGTFSVYTDHTCYERTNNNFNQRLLTLDWQTLQWEEDVADNCRKNSGDDCLTEYDGSFTNAVDISSNNCRYGNTEYQFDDVYYDFSGSGGYNYFHISYMFEIRPSIGTTYTNAFEFIDFDPSNGCFRDVNHCLNTSNRTSNYVWYKFELNHKRSIEIDFSTQSPANNINSCYLYNASLSNLSPQSTGVNTLSFYNLTPGIYYIRLHRSNAFNSTGKYNLKINQLSVSTSSVDYYWTGSNSDNDWFNPCNWSTNRVPDNTNNVIIQNTTNNPIISVSGSANGQAAGQAYCNTIVVENNALVSIANGAKLNVTQ